MSDEIAQRYAVSCEVPAPLGWVVFRMLQARDLTLWRPERLEADKARSALHAELERTRRRLDPQEREALEKALCVDTSREQGPISQALINGWLAAREYSKQREEETVLEREIGRFEDRRKRAQEELDSATREGERLKRALSVLKGEEAA